jgi:quinol monooxygenase YgiN
MGLFVAAALAAGCKKKEAEKAATTTETPAAAADAQASAPDAAAAAAEPAKPAGGMGIDKGVTTHTVIFEFNVKPDEQKKLAPEIERLVRDIVSKQPGFQHSALHLSKDGEKIFNYFQWENEAVFTTFKGNEEAQKQIKPVIGPFKPAPRVYTVAYSAYAEGKSGPAPIVNNLHTVISEFNVKPDEQKKLAPEIERLVRDVVSKQPGFVSSHLHLSTDGEKILNYFQWESPEVFETFKANKAAQDQIKPVIGPYKPVPKVYDIPVVL